MRYLIRKKKQTFFFLVLIPFLSIAQQECVEPDFEDNCAEAIYSVFEDYLYLKSRAFISTEKIDVQFSVTLKKNVLYIFNVCQHGRSNSMVLELYDGNEKLLCSSYNDKTKKNDKIITFLPEFSGKYYLTTYFEKEEEGCCLIMMGMINENVEQYIVSKKGL